MCLFRDRRFVLPCGLLIAVCVHLDNLPSRVFAKQSAQPSPHQSSTANHGGGSVDVVIYGGTSAGIAAAIQVKRMGRSVVVIEPGTRIGGLTTGGLGQTDIGNKAAIGGVSREFYRQVRKHYSDDAHWNWQTRDAYQTGGQTLTGKNEDTMWTFEPSAALSILEQFVREYEIPVVYGERLDRTLLAEGSRRVAGVEL